MPLGINKLIKVVTGIRRCGKSTLLEIYQNWLLDQGIDERQIISINFEDIDFEELTDYRKLYEYLKESYDLSGEQNTIKSYLIDIKKFITYFKNEFGEDIVDFSRADYMEFKKYMKEKRGFKFSTINRKTAALSVYENFLIETKIRKEDIKIIKKKDFYKIDRPFITSQMLPKDTIKKVR